MMKYPRASSLWSFPAFRLSILLLIAVISFDLRDGAQGFHFVPSTLVIGHRGDCAHYPENTMISFTNAIAKKCALFETDLRLSKDEQVVLIHDEWVNRTTNGKGLVADMTLTELKLLDAGSWFNPEFAGQRIPTLKEALQLITSRPDLSVVMDLKVEGLGQYIAPIVNELGLQDRVIASCWTDTQVQDISRYMNITVKQKLTGSLPANITNSYFSDLLRKGVHAFSVRYDFITAPFISSAHQHAMPVNAWTVDDAGIAEQLITIGVDGIITDDVKLIRDLVENFNLASSSTGKEDDHRVADGLKSGAVAAIAVTTGIVGAIIGALLIVLWNKRRPRTWLYQSIEEHQA